MAPEICEKVQKKKNCWHGLSMVWLKGRFILQVKLKKYPEASRRVQSREKRKLTGYGQGYLRKGKIAGAGKKALSYKESKWVSGRREILALGQEAGMGFYSDVLL